MLYVCLQRHTYTDDLLYFPGNQMFSSDSAQANLLQTLLGVVLGPVTGQIGLQCSPLSVIGIAGNSWLAILILFLIKSHY